MCILFMFAGSKEDSGDYSLILASNRDENYDRPTKNLAPWVEDNQIIGGRDLQEGSGGGTWLAISPLRKRLGVLLNIPGNSLENAHSRGKLVADFVRNTQSPKDYVESIKSYTNECNEFIFVSVVFRKCDENILPQISSYSNVSNSLTCHEDQFLGFGNCLPDNPLKKVKAGKHKFEKICTKLNKIHQKEKLIEELLVLLKCEERHLPDPQLQQKRPKNYEDLSSICVSIPKLRYGTRTHTLILVSKTGHVEVIEFTLEDPVDTANLSWKRTEYDFDIC